MDYPNQIMRNAQTISQSHCDHSGSQYMSVSMTCWIYEMFMNAANDFKEVEDGILVEIATWMEEKLTLYSSLVNSALNFLCGILDPMFANAGEEDKMLLRKYWRTLVWKLKKCWTRMNLEKKVCSYRFLGRKIGRAFQEEQRARLMHFTGIRSEVSFIYWPFYMVKAEQVSISYNCEIRERCFRLSSIFRSFGVRILYFQRPVWCHELKTFRWIHSSGYVASIMTAIFSNMFWLRTCSKISLPLYSELLSKASWPWFVTTMLWIGYGYVMGLSDWLRFG